MFTIIGQDGECKLSTEYIECLPNLNCIDNMLKAGYKFKEDNKALSKGKLTELISSIDKTKISKDNNNVKYIIKCITTDEVFDTQSQAAKAYGIDPAQVSDSIKTGRPRSGYIFQKVVANI